LRCASSPSRVLAYFFELLGCHQIYTGNYPDANQKVSASTNNSKPEFKPLRSIAKLVSQSNPLEADVTKSEKCELRLPLHRS
jgi:hypothetical protein